MSTMIIGPDGKSRCRWCGAAPEFLDYHDAEWVFPVSDDHRLFEKLSLESFQSGSSWRTILAKRENFSAAFHDFDFDRIALHSARPRSFAQERSVQAFHQCLIRLSHACKHIV
ncbi:MAG: DNA-3-methyladenine glycosylase I [Candidatus Thiodiazotropha sp. (ex Epidulcina cf. delphinae)]|nr:DNA-3-methyladenine glycosylase I [Candidatus Thiodiazotropha sp. (ex Epidulcina cf. delphinae)]